MAIITTIIPIFTVILIGWLLRQRKFIQPAFIEPANRLVFYIAIPAMIFKAIINASFEAQYDPLTLGITMASLAAFFGISWGAAVFFNLEKFRRGAFIQSSFHCNMGYIGLAVSYYYLGNEGLAKASILTGFSTILQNFLSVIALQVNADDSSGRIDKMGVIVKILRNPVILSAFFGIMVSILKIPIPTVIARILDIVSGMSLPMALLIIGASLSFTSLKDHWSPLMLSGAMKLILLPGFGYLCYSFFGLASNQFLPGLILLAAPTATISYVMAKEMKGDADFAVSAISVTTLMASLTYMFWLTITL